MDWINYNQPMTKLYSFIAASMHNHYTIHLADQTVLTLFIGKHNPELDQLLRGYGVASYSYLTAFNPKSTTLSIEENQIRQAALLQELDKLGYRFLTGTSFPEDGGWQPEECAFVFDLPVNITRQLCLQNNQDAAVIGEVGGVPKLFFTNPALSRDFLQLIQNCVVE